jgi:hypothetical protein
MLMLAVAPFSAGQEYNFNPEEMIAAGHAPDTVLVGFRPEAGRGGPDAVAQEFGLERIKHFKQIDVGVFRVPGGDAPGAAMRIATHEAVAFAEPNYIRRTCFTPNDPNYGQQWGFPKINAEAAWDVTLGSSDVIVAVIDTGIDQDHPDLVNQRWINAGEIAGNGVDDDGNGYVDDRFGYDFFGNAFLGIFPPGEGAEDNDPEDDMGHGSHTAGTVAAQTDNAIGVAGTASGCRVMVVRALGTIFGFGYSSDIIEAQLYAADNGADIISMSLGSPQFSQAELNAAIYAESLGVLVVAAAGNDGDQTLSYPAGYPMVMAVSATTSGDGIASFSTRGANVEVAAPGQGIVSCWTGAGYQSADGTSMACPHAAGVCALALSLNTAITAGQARQMVRNGAIDLGTAGWDLKFGVGRLDAHAAVTAAVPDAGQIALFTPGDGSTLNSGSIPFGFGWSRVSGADTYALQFKTPGGLVKTLTGLGDNFFYPSQGTWTSMPRGTYQWRAGALDANGNLLSATGWWHFTR